MSTFLLIGDSHIIHAFNKKPCKVIYVRDITLNQLRKNNNNVNICYSHYEGNNEKNFDTYIIANNSELNLVDYINNSPCECVVISIGEIDVRFHLVKQLKKDIHALLKINDIYEAFLKKIKKKIIVVSLPPPAFTEDELQTRKEITQYINQYRQKMCSKNNWLYYDLYTRFEKDGILDTSKSDGQVHTSSCFIDENISILRNLIVVD